MRKLRLTRSDERGVAAVMVALMATMLLAAAGLGVDTAHVVFDRSRVQHGADAAALAIALDCALGKSTCSKPGADSIAADYVQLNAGGGTGGISAASLAPVDGKVTVDAAKTVSVNFFQAFGVSSKDTGAKASAEWAHAVGGTVLPFLVSMCEYTKAKPAAPATEGSSTFLASNLNDIAKSDFGGKPQTVLNPYLDSCLTPAGTNAPGLPASVKMLKGGLWESVTGNNVCNGTISLEIFSKPPDVQAGNEGCTKKYDEDLKNAPGGVVLLAIYAPSVNYQYSGVRADASSVIINPANFGVQIIGFAPFKVSGWCLGQPLQCGGVNPGKEGISGKFLNTTKLLPGVTYGNAGTSFGALVARLVG